MYALEMCSRFFPCFGVGAILLLIADRGCGQTTDLWDLPPVRYSDSQASDPMTQWAREMEEGKGPVDLSGLELLNHVLRRLEVPVESQILVFSKTSKQNSLIHPDTPRALFFHENAYVGYVPGGDVEVITHDPMLGAVFYLVTSGKSGSPPNVRRDTSSCVSCHGGGRTEGVPGVLIRSVFPDGDGQPIATLGSFDIDARTPVAERWGGYYVTGRSSLPHLGNRTFAPSTQRIMPDAAVELETLRHTIPTRRYPRETSDIVALMVLEHQCRVHNLISHAALQYRRFAWLQAALDPQADPDDGDAGRIAERSAKEIVAALLFRDEADLGDGVEGDPAFQEAFSRRFPKSKSGKSLADFHLQSRMFKNRCSYMIYSHVFSTAPARIQEAVIRELRRILVAPEVPADFSHITSSERKRIVEILEDTHPAWKNHGSSGAMRKRDSPVEGNPLE